MPIHYELCCWLLPENLKKINFNKYTFLQLIILNVCFLCLGQIYQKNTWHFLIIKNKGNVAKIHRTRFNDDFTLFIKA